MPAKAKKPEDMTWADIRATLAEATLLSKDNEKGLKELKEAVSSTSDELTRIIKEREVADKKREKEHEVAAKEREIADKKREKEREIAAKEREKGLKELKEAVAKTNEAVFGTNREVKGIAKSNNMMSEDYFYESLDKSKTLGGLHFDIVVQDMKSAQKQKNGSKLEGQYDVVMINDIAVCIIEVKYRVRKEDVLEVVNKDVDVFKTLFPQYANYQIYLAIGGMAFEKGAVDTAKKLGMGVLKLNGDALEVYDKNLKVY